MAEVPNFLLMRHASNRQTRYFNPAGSIYRPPDPGHYGCPYREEARNRYSRRSCPSRRPRLVWLQSGRCCSCRPSLSPCSLSIRRS